MAEPSYTPTNCRVQTTLTLQPITTVVVFVVELLRSNCTFFAGRLVCFSPEVRDMHQGWQDDP